MTQSQLEAIKKADEVVTGFTYVENGTDQNGYTMYKIIYTEKPLNFQLVHIDVDSKLAILKDLDYVQA